MAAKARSFKATLEPGGDNLNWVIAYLPFDVFKTWGSRAQVKVEGTVNGFAFRTSVFPNGKGRHFLMVNKAMQKGGNAFAGSLANFRLAPDTAPREAVVPKELASALAEDAQLKRWFGKLNYSTRKFLCDRVHCAKQSHTRARRAEQVAELLLQAMEAERELPPLIGNALARNPKARQGWEKMSAAKRRGHIMGIYYYATPEARGRRLEKALQEAVARGSSS